MKILTFRGFLEEEAARCAIVNKKQLDDLEKFGDRLLDKYGIDIEFG